MHVQQTIGLAVLVLAKLPSYKHHFPMEGCVTKDRASYRNRGGIIQKLVTTYKRIRYFTKAGKNLVVKRSAEFRTVGHAVLEVGENVIISTDHGPISGCS